LTPTIADIKSEKAYRRIDSNRTDSSGDIYKFYCYKGAKGSLLKRIDPLFQEISVTVATVGPTDYAMKTIPDGIEFEVLLQCRLVSVLANNGDLIITEKPSGQAILACPDVSLGNHDTTSFPVVFVNTSRQIRYDLTANVSDVATGVYSRGFNDYRNYY
jgi:hypothetical protein